VRLAGLEFPADSHDESGLVLLHVCVLALLRRKSGVHVLKLLRVYKADAALKLRQNSQLRIYSPHRVLRIAYRGDDIHDRELEIVPRAVLREDNFFPVPLVDVDRVQIVKLVLVAADGVHVRIQSLAGEEAVALERKALPLCQRLHDLRLCLRAQDIERYRALIAVEVVVQTGLFIDEQRRGNAVQVKLRAEVLLKKTLEQAYRFLRIIYRKQALVIFGYVR